MERNKKQKLKNKILKLLPKAVSSLTFRSPPFSPGRSHQAGAGRGFSAPMVSIIPDEARRRKKGESLDGDQEPTSPKVSCMGKIKNRKNINHKKQAKPQQQQQQLAVSPREVPANDERKKTSNVLKIFNTRAKSKEKKEKMEGCSADDHNGSKKVINIPDKDVPGLGQIKMFSSGRRDRSLGNFDWAAQIAPMDSDHQSYHSDEDREIAEYYGDDEEEEEGDYRVTFSAPIVRGSGDHLVLKPRKEVNLWRRRTMHTPRPLQMNPMYCE